MDRRFARCWTSGTQPERHNSDSLRNVASWRLSVPHGRNHRRHCIAGIIVRTFQPADFDFLSIKQPLQMTVEVPLRTRTATEQVQAKRTVLRKRVTCEVGFRKKAKAGDAGGLWKLMPSRFTARMQVEVPNHAGEESFHRIEVAEQLGTASVSLNNPFRASHHSLAAGFPQV